MPIIHISHLHLQETSVMIRQHIETTEVQKNLEKYILDNFEEALVYVDRYPAMQIYAVYDNLHNANLFYIITKQRINNTPYLANNQHQFIDANQLYKRFL